MATKNNEGADVDIYWLIEEISGGLSNELKHLVKNQRRRKR